MTEDEIQNEIETVHEKVKQLTGMEMELFRAPYGDYNDTVTAAAEKSGYLPVLYDVDSEDWKDYGVESILRSVVQNPELGSGSIILMHIDANYTAQALESVITNLQSQGYALVTVSDLMG
jgi:peptidoglycan/xylan/chitin deacetylase (PgdA/CDA1 family)